jgi:hypothetical protein
MCKGALGEVSEEFNWIKWRHNYVLSEFIDSVSPYLIENGFKIFVVYCFMAFQDSISDSSRASLSLGT